MMYATMEQPHLQHHHLFVATITKLQEELETTRVARVDMIFHFMAQSIDAEYRNIVGTFRDDAKRVLRFLLYEQQTPFQAVRSAFPTWPPSLIGRIHLSDIRNAFVYNIYKTFGHMLDTSHIPFTNPPAPEEISNVYRSIAHGRPTIVDPKDSERLLTLFRCIHISRLALCLLNNTTPKDIVQTYNSCVGAWMHSYLSHGMTMTVFKLFLDVYHYDHAWDNPCELEKSSPSNA